MCAKYYIETEELDTINGTLKDNSAFGFESGAPYEYFKGFVTSCTMKFTPTFEKTTLIYGLKCVTDKGTETVSKYTYYCEGSGQHKKIELIHYEEK